METRAEPPLPSKRVQVEKEQELRIRSLFSNEVTLKVLQGTAEIFGTELAQEVEYRFSGTSIACFSWTGCWLQITGECHSYTAGETPMMAYANIHASLDERRTIARSNQSNGPRVIVVGPTDSGKTSLCKLLVSYGRRRNHHVTFVDLDVGQGCVTPPGVLCAVPVERPVDVERGFAALGAPLVYFYGHATLQENPKLYRMQLSNLAGDISARFQKNPLARAGGLVVNTCGWVDDLGYTLLTETILTLQCDVVLVIDNDRLFNDLHTLKQSNHTCANMRVVKVPKSGGAVTRDGAFRRQSRMQRCRAYFYGESLRAPLCPRSSVFSFDDLSFYRIGGGPQAPRSALPIGAERTVDAARLSEVTPTNELTHSLLAVSLAEDAKNIVLRNIAGFVYVTDVDLVGRRITLLAPCPGPLPSRFLLLGSIKWLES